MTIKQFDVWLADLNPRFGTEAGKVRPVVIIQTNLLNKVHPSTIICPITTNVKPKAQILRVHIQQNEAGVNIESDILIDQIRAIDNKRLINKIGVLSLSLAKQVKQNIKIVLDLD